MPELVCGTGDRAAWLAARRSGVTATDIVTILGLSSHDSPYSLYWRKMGQIPEEPDNDQFRLGRYLERYILMRWLDEHHISDWPEPDQRLYHSTARPWQMATPDYLDPDGLPLELKSWADADRSAWQDGLPPAVRCQVLWQMDTMDVGTGHVGVVFLPSGEFRSYVIEHLNGAQCWSAECLACVDLILMRDAGLEFYRRLTMELPPPDPDSSAATLAAVKARFAKQPDKQTEVDELTFATWIAARALADDHAAEARALEIQLREQAGEAGQLTIRGELVARRVIVDAQVKAHTRHQDYIRRIRREESPDE